MEEVSLAVMDRRMRRRPGAFCWQPSPPPPACSEAAAPALEATPAAVTASEPATDVAVMPVQKQPPRLLLSVQVGEGVERPGHAEGSEGSSVVVPPLSESAASAPIALMNALPPRQGTKLKLKNRTLTRCEVDAIYSAA
mmetsp:Transcript_108723/g.273524  ORF Transcript_108723/g.273524 Transcript_108723/m.273524 type:complete len:139 (-) Transcript_108723:10-426(-)